MNRNYFQTPPVVLNLIIINVLIFMATALLPKAGNAIMEYCALSLGTPFFHVYQFITCMPISNISSSTCSLSGCSGVRLSMNWGRNAF